MAAQQPPSEVVLDLRNNQVDLRSKKKKQHIENSKERKRIWMGRDLNSRPPVCKTGILTRLDYPSGKTARQLSGSILIVFGVACARMGTCVRARERK
jgi:hypothetical protein